MQTPENMVLFKRVVERVVDRMLRGESHPRRQLPLRKADFPKLLCLDQNKWIELGKAHYHRSGGERFQDALGAIREGIAKGRVIVPVMPSNLIEVSEPADEGRRQRIAEFMVDMSGNCSMANPEIVEPVELKHAVMRQFVHEDPGPFPRHRLIAWGMAYALGKQMIDDSIRRAIEEPEISVLAMVHAMDRESIAAGRAFDEKAASVARTARAGDLAEEQRRVSELYNLFLATGTTAELLKTVVAELGIDQQAFFAWLAGNPVPFSEEVPNACVVNRLLLARDRSDDNKTHQNDLKDFTFLKLAIPYGNIVVTENLWTHLTHAEGLDRKYGTTVIADLRDLRACLAEHGCL
jgi:hypothetical protein